MKNKIFLLIILGMFFLYIVPLISSLQATIIKYNFTTNLSDRNAYFEYPATANAWNTTEVAGFYGNATSARYTALGSPGGTTANVWAHGGNDNPFWKFNFTVKEANLSRNQIQWLNVNVTGYDNATAAEVGKASIWNFTSGAFVQFGTLPDSTAGIRSMNYTGNANATNFIQPATSNVVVYVLGPSFDAIDGLFIDFVEVQIMYLKDVNAPAWSSNMTNGTLAGSTINHSVNWTDDVGFSGYIFSFNNGNGTFLNDTWQPMTSDNWTNITKNVNSTVGSIINWSVYVNDSSNNWNVTSIFNYTTTGATDSCSCPAVNNNWLIINGDQCTLSASCNLGTGTLRVLSGALRIGSTGILNANHCFVQNAQNLFVTNGGKLSCR
jgi:hypothetical protein